MSRKEMVDFLVNIGWDLEELAELDDEALALEVAEYNDTSAMHPNETLEEFLEHEF